MKTNIFPIVATAMLGMAMMSSCGDDKWNADITEGGIGQLETYSIAPTVNAVENEFSDEKPASRGVISLSDYLVTITDSKGAVVNDWVYSSMPSLPDFAVGTYTVTVRSHEVKPAEWSAPYYKGSQSFNIVKNEVTRVSPMTCTLANIKVSVVFEDKLLAVGGEDYKVIVTSTPGTSLDFTPEETRSGYFEAADNLETLEVKFTGTVSGNVENTTAVLTNVAAGQHRKVTLRLKQNGNTAPGENGHLQVDGKGINVDFSVTEENLTVELPWKEGILDSDDRPNQGGNDEGGSTPTPPVDPDQPIEDVITFNSATLDLVGINNAKDFDGTGKEAVVVISAEHGFKNLMVQIVSQSLNKEMLQSVGLDNEFDLAYPGTLKDALSTSFGFPVGDEVIGKTEVTFDITNFVPLLNIYPNENHNFVITVIDQKNNQKAMTLKFKA